MTRHLNGRIAKMAVVVFNRDAPYQGMSFGDGREEPCRSMNLFNLFLQERSGWSGLNATAEKTS